MHSKIDRNMMGVLIVLCLTAFVTAQTEIDDTTTTVYDVEANQTHTQYDEPAYERFIEFPDGEGVLHTVDLEEEPDMELLNDTLNAKRNKYILFTRYNPDAGQLLIINDENSIKESNFNPKNPTIIIAHGWLSNQNTGINPTIKKAYLGTSDTNVIVLDWRRLAGSTYVTAVRGVPAVGRGLGKFLKFLSMSTGAPLSSMHLIGFSLGGHLVGNAGRILDGKVARITALDPAGPLWYFNPYKLKSSDSLYVEVIHTNRRSLGIDLKVGDNDFYPSGGAAQPGCLTKICHHNRAWEIFASTVKYNHLIAKKCTDSDELESDTCRGDELPMGNDELSKTGDGMYRVNTRSRYPY